MNEHRDAATGKGLDAWPVWANGEIHGRADRVLSANDEGFLLGLSVFDTVLLEDGVLYFLEDHIARLRRGGAELAIPWPPPWDVADAMRETAAAIGDRNAAVRVTLSRGVAGGRSTLVVTTRPVTPLPAEGVPILVSSYHKLGGNPLEGVKSTNRLRNILAREEAEAAGAWEALLPNHEGDFSECTTANVFAVCNATLVTPSIERGCLGGIIREKLLENLAADPLVLDDGARIPVVEGRLEAEDLHLASEVFLTNTTGRVIPVRAVLGLDPAPAGLLGAAGPIAGILRERMRGVEAAYRARCS